MKMEVKILDLHKNNMKTFSVLVFGSLEYSMKQNQGKTATKKDNMRVYEFRGQNFSKTYAMETI